MDTASGHGFAAPDDRYEPATTRATRVDGYGDQELRPMPGREVVAIDAVVSRGDAVLCEHATLLLRPRRQVALGGSRASLLPVGRWETTTIRCSWPMDADFAAQLELLTRLAGSTRQYRKAIDLSRVASVDLRLQNGAEYRGCRLDIPSSYRREIEHVEFPVRHRSL